jgi:hypothetical protein
VGISDHHTRVAVGGSHMATDAPVVGLLFGVQAGLEISILDAQEMEYSFSSAKAAASGDNTFGGGSAAEQSEHKASLEIKIELHKKVFPTHEVVGWYRVHPISDAATDTMDVQTSATVRGFLHESCSNPMMLRMHPDVGAGENTNSQQELPIRIFESITCVDAQQHCTTNFVPLEFEVNTGEPERIAVEKAFSDQPAVRCRNASRMRFYHFCLSNHPQRYCLFFFNGLLFSFARAGVVPTMDWTCKCNP